MEKTHKKQGKLHIAIKKCNTNLSLNLNEIIWTMFKSPELHLNAFIQFVIASSLTLICLELNCHRIEMKRWRIHSLNNNEFISVISFEMRAINESHNWTKYTHWCGVSKWKINYNYFWLVSYHIFWLLLFVFIWENWKIHDVIHFSNPHPFCSQPIHSWTKKKEKSKKIEKKEEEEGEERSAHTSNKRIIIMIKQKVHIVCYKKNQWNFMSFYECTMKIIRQKHSVPLNDCF